MSKQSTITGKLKIGELAKLSGVSIPTIKFYIREGLISRPVSDGRKVSNYDPEYVDRLILIKKLQKERFLPLNVIKKLIAAEGTVSAEEVVMIGIDVTNHSESLLKNNKIKKLHYTKEKIERLEAEGLIQSLDLSGEKEYDPIDSQIISLVKQRENAGLPFDYTLKVMGIYQKHFQKAVHEDTKNFLKWVTENVEENDLFSFITEGEKTAATYFKLVHTKLARLTIEKIINSHDMISLHIVEALNFRRLEEAGPISLASGKAGDYGQPLWSILQHTLEPPDESESVPDSNSKSPATGIQRIIEGVLDLQEGKTDEAIVSFDSVLPSQTISPLSFALNGLSHIMKTSRTTGLIIFIRDLKNAIRCFNASLKPSSNAMVNILTAYFRLVGFAVRPNIFDMQPDALEEYSRLEKILEGLKAEEYYGKETVFQAFKQELILKSTYFLVLMYQACQEYTKAGHLLERMIKTGEESFYTGWALKKKREIQNSV
ncbi:MerR family transcriptional regulator [bacterium]|nr:MerR family transcriptional regulator [bacterium]